MGSGSAAGEGETDNTFLCGAKRPDTSQLAHIGEPLAATQPTEKFYSKPYFGVSSGLFPPGKKPPPKLMGFPKGGGRLDPQHRVLRKYSQWVRWLPEALLGTTQLAHSLICGLASARTQAEPLPGPAALFRQPVVTTCPIGAHMCPRGWLGWSGTPGLGQQRGTRAH